MAFTAPEAAAALERLQERLNGAVLISTCNRTELYTTGPLDAAYSDQMAPLLMQLKGVDLNPSRFYLVRHDTAVRHLYRVASGIDSMVVGEAQILGQVREALSAATRASSLNGILSRLFHTALAVGKRARSETRIGRYTSSVSGAAVALARQMFGGLEGRHVLIISAGSTGKLAAKALRESGAQIAVTNRTHSRALELARELGGKAVPADGLTQALEQADVVISATGSNEFVLDERMLRPVVEARQARPLLLIDIAVPRDVDPSVTTLPGVRLYDIDDLAATPEGSNNGRGRSEIERVELIVEEEVERFLGWWRALDAVPVISALREQAESVRRKELDKALRKLPNLSEEERARVESMTRAIINKMLHQPVTRLKTSADSGRHLEALQDLFGLPEGLSEPQERE